MITMSSLPPMENKSQHASAMQVQRSQIKYGMPYGQINDKYKYSMYLCYRYSTAQYTVHVRAFCMVL